MAKTNYSHPVEEAQGRPVVGLRVWGTSRVFFFENAGCGQITIGRTRQREFRIDDDTVSKLHCVIERTDAGLYRIKDCDSMNGLHVADLWPYNDFRKIDWHFLRFGSHLRLGNVTLVPVDSEGKCLIAAFTHSDYMRNARDAYGTFRQLAGHIRLPFQTIRRWFERAKKVLGL